MRTKDYVARFLGVSKAQVDRLKDSGELHFIRIGDLVRFTDADVSAYIERRRGVVLKKPRPPKAPEAA